MKEENIKKEESLDEDIKEGEMNSKIVIGLAIGGFLGYLVTNTILGAIVGAILGGYMALKL